jgi:2-keto-4-pentenoate hydratase/2-oxohepta-3-ene-1,7-dioic acid hydratase in catechol pathway
MQVGDVVKVKIDGIGTLRNKLIALEVCTIFY